jgi:hypothetical protein
MQMRPFEIRQLKVSKEQYYARLGFADNGGRAHKESTARAAFVSAFRNHATLHELGEAIDKDHSKRCLCRKDAQRQANLRGLSALLQGGLCVLEENPMACIDKPDFQSLQLELNKLNEVVMELSKYKELYLTLKRTFDEF